MTVGFRWALFFGLVGAVSFGAHAASIVQRPTTATPAHTGASHTARTVSHTTGAADAATPTHHPSAAAIRRARIARSRAATAARARRLAARQRREEQVVMPQLNRDELGNFIPYVRAAAAIVFNPVTGQVLWEENSHDQRSIASLTKLMTAVVLLADDPDLTREVEVTRPDVTNASVTHLRAGDQIQLGELLHLMIIASDNGAARVLARTSDGSTPAFVQRMNDMAQQLNLTGTHYADPTGLDPDNVSTAFDISHLISFASSDDRIGSIMRTQSYDVHTTAREIPIHSTDKLLSTGVGMNVLGGKTGFINKAGYCFATLLQIPQGTQVAVVVLGAASSATRFLDARNMFAWAADHASTVAVAAPDAAVKQ
jgi:serine-type D-Ala-D-Ala endopeptidase (penicillin-binding protein 7)